MDHDSSSKAKATETASFTAVEEKQEIKSEKELSPPTASLSEKEKDLIDRQLTAPNLTVGYFSLFRYATAKDKAIMVVALIASIAAGAVLPLMTVSTTYRLCAHRRQGGLGEGSKHTSRPQPVRH